MSIGGVAVLTEEERIIEKRMVRRIDFMILSLVILVYLMNYIDRYGLIRAIYLGY